MICSRNGSVHIYFTPEYSLAHLNNVYEVKCEYEKQQHFNHFHVTQTDKQTELLPHSLTYAGTLLLILLLILLLLLLFCYHILVYLMSCLCDTLQEYDCNRLFSLLLPFSCTF